jgi:bacteriorhodopsin
VDRVSYVSFVHEYLRAVTDFCSVWGVAGNARKTTVDTETMIYAVLDALVKPVFGVWLLLSNRAIADTNIDLDGFWSHGLAAEGRIRVGDEE